MPNIDPQKSQQSDSPDPRIQAAVRQALLTLDAQVEDPISDAAIAAIRTLRRTTDLALALEAVEAIFANDRAIVDYLLKLRILPEGHVDHTATNAALEAVHASSCETLIALCETFGAEVQNQVANVLAGSSIVNADLAGRCLKEIDLEQLSPHTIDCATNILRRYIDLYQITAEQAFLPASDQSGFEAENDAGDGELDSEMDESITREEADDIIAKLTLEIIYGAKSNGDLRDVLFRGSLALLPDEEAEEPEDSPTTKTLFREALVELYKDKLDELAQKVIAKIDGFSLETSAALEIVSEFLAQPKSINAKISLELMQKLLILLADAKAESAVLYCDQKYPDGRPSAEIATSAPAELAMDIVEKIVPILTGLRGYRNEEFAKHGYRLLDLVQKNWMLRVDLLSLIGTTTLDAPRFRHCIETALAEWRERRDSKQTPQEDLRATFCILIHTLVLAPTSDPFFFQTYKSFAFGSNSEERGVAADDFAKLSKDVVVETFREFLAAETNLHVLRLGIESVVCNDALTLEQRISLMNETLSGKSKLPVRKFRNLVEQAIQELEEMRADQGKAA